MQGAPLLGISRLSTWEFWDKMTFGYSPMANHKEQYKGEGGGFPQVRAMVSFVSLCTKYAPTMN